MDYPYISIKCILRTNKLKSVDLYKLFYVSEIQEIDLSTQNLR